MIIKNEKDLYKFYKKLPLYRSILYKNKPFEIQSKYDIKDIITALNIKNRKERLTFIYNKACQQIDEYYKNKNICGFKNQKCYVQQKLNNGNINGCCRYCNYQSIKGCTTSNLTCKLFTCSEIEKRCQIIKYEEIKVLKLLTKRQKLITKSNYFTKKEDFIKDLYIGSFVIWEIKQTIRITKMYIKKKLFK